MDQTQWSCSIRFDAMQISAGTNFSDRNSRPNENSKKNEKDDDGQKPNPHSLTIMNGRH